MPPKKTKTKKTKRRKQGKLKQIKQLLDSNERLVALLRDCGFETEKYGAISDLEASGQEINKMLMNLLGEQWWKLELPKKKDDAKASA